VTSIAAFVPGRSWKFAYDLENRPLSLAQPTYSAVGFAFKDQKASKRLTLRYSPATQRLRPII
jgi:hypothetical protein